MWRELLSRITRGPRRHLCPESRGFAQGVITATRFWRNSPQLEVLTTRVLPRLAQAAGGPALRVAVHGGSVGCEALSLVMAARHWELDHPLEVVSFDIDPRAIAWARAGVYGPEHLQEPGNPQRQLLPPAVAQRCLSAEAPGRLRVTPEVHQAVRFEVCDMLDARAMRRFGVFDLVLCQNVLLHLKPDMARAALGNLIEALGPSGLLVLGGTPPAQLAELTSHWKLHPLALANRAVYEAWSGRLAVWRSSPSSHLGLEPYEDQHPSAGRRYAHLFATGSGMAFWADYTCPAVCHEAA